MVRFGMTGLWNGVYTTGEAPNWRPVMRMHFLTLAMLVGTMCLSSHPGNAADGPWCAIVDLGPGSSVERCHFRTFEACRQEITGGNRGFCRPSQWWSGVSPYDDRGLTRRRAR
jgi:hypothetical protein